MVERDNWDLTEEGVPEPAEGEFLAYGDHRHLTLCSTKVLAETVKERKLLAALRKRHKSKRASPNTRRSGGVIDKVPSSYVGARGAQLNR